MTLKQRQDKLRSLMNQIVECDNKVTPFVEYVDGLAEDVLKDGNLIEVAFYNYLIDSAHDLLTGIIKVLERLNDFADLLNIKELEQDGQTTIYS